MGHICAPMLITLVHVGHAIASRATTSHHMAPLPLHARAWLMALALRTRLHVAFVAMHTSARTRTHMPTIRHTFAGAHHMSAALCCDLAHTKSCDHSDHRKENFCCWFHFGYFTSLNWCRGGHLRSACVRGSKPQWLTAGFFRVLDFASMPAKRRRGYAGRQAIRGGLSSGAPNRPKRTSFSMAYNDLSKGGRYIIEGTSKAEWQDAPQQSEQHPSRQGPPAELGHALPNAMVLRCKLLARCLPIVEFVTSLRA